MPLFRTLSWEVPRSAEEIGMVLRQAVIDQWRIPEIDVDPAIDSYEVNETTSTFIVKNYKTKYKVTIQEIE